MQGKTARMWRAFGGERVARKRGMLPQTNLQKVENVVDARASRASAYGRPCTEVHINGNDLKTYIQK